MRMGTFFVIKESKSLAQDFSVLITQAMCVVELIVADAVDAIRVVKVKVAILQRHLTAPRSRERNRKILRWNINKVFYFAGGVGNIATFGIGTTLIESTLA